MSVNSIPDGYRGAVATHIEDVPPEELEERAAEAMEECGEPPGQISLDE